MSCKSCYDLIGDYTLFPSRKYPLDYIKEKCQEYIEKFANDNTYNIGKLKVSTISYCDKLPFFHASFWIVDLELIINKNFSCYYKTILISDDDGSVIEAFQKWEQINGKTMLSKEKVLNIANEYLETIQKNTNSNYKISLSESFYYICKRNQTNKYESIWCIAFMDEKMKIISEQVEYLQIPDLLDNSYAILNNNR